MFGYDTGIISGALLLLKRHFGLSSVWQEVVVSVTILSAWLFSLMAMFLVERFGRKPCILLCSVWFTTGSVLMAVAQKNVWFIVLGRLIVGAAIGLSSAAGTLYIAEVSTPEMRGKLVTLNNCLITGKSWPMTHKFLIVLHTNLSMLVQTMFGSFETGF